jgi:hypothetical protein
MNTETGIPASGGRPEQVRERSGVTLLLGVGLVVLGSLWAFDHFRLRAANRALTEQLYESLRHSLEEQIRFSKREKQHLANKFISTDDFVATITVGGKGVVYEALPEELRRHIESEIETYLSKTGKPESDK